MIETELLNSFKDIFRCLVSGEDWDAKQMEVFTHSPDLEAKSLERTGLLIFFPLALCFPCLLAVCLLHAQYAACWACPYEALARMFGHWDFASQ